MNARGIDEHLPTENICILFQRAALPVNPKLEQPLAGLAVGLFLSVPTYTLDVAYVLACSAFAGVLMERT